MPFVNERISKEDFEAYKLDEIYEEILGCGSSRNWCIDRKENSFLHKLSQGGQENTNNSCWLFFINNQYIILYLDLKIVYETDSPDKLNWIIKKIRFLNGDPIKLKDFYDFFLDALTVHQLAADVRWPEHNVISLNSSVEGEII